MNLTFAVNVTLNLSINKKYFKFAFNRKLSTNFLVTDTKFSKKIFSFFLFFTAPLEKSKHFGFLKSCRDLEHIEDSHLSTFSLNRTQK